MECHNIHKKIEAYFDGHLSVDESQAIAEHLKTCARCRAELEELQQLDHYTKKIPVLEPEKQYWDELPGRILRQLPKRKKEHLVHKLFSFRSNWSMTFKLAGALASAVIIFVVVHEVTKKEPLNMGFVANEVNNTSKSKESKTESNSANINVQVKSKEKTVMAPSVAGGGVLDSNTPVGTLGLTESTGSNDSDETDYSILSGREANVKSVEGEARTITSGSNPPQPILPAAPEEMRVAADKTEDSGQGFDTSVQLVDNNSKGSLSKKAPPSSQMSYAGKGAAQSSKEVIQTPAVTMFHDRGRQEFHPKYNAVTLEEMSQTQTLKDTISALEFALKLAKTKGLGSTEVARKYYEQLQRQSGVDTVIATVEAAEILTAKDMSRDDLIIETAQLYFELVEKQNVSDLKILAQNFYQTNKTVLIKSLGQELYTKQSERLR